MFRLYKFGILHSLKDSHSPLGHLVEKYYLTSGSTKFIYFNFFNEYHQVIFTTKALHNGRIKLTKGKKQKKKAFITCKGLCTPSTKIWN